ncbi:hypothetical protein KH400_23000, partial [Desertibacillus haloalkaliphilus]|nr:hypothetical protein [Desertibacillus haloalkaliphilus]
MAELFFVSAYILFVIALIYKVNLHFSKQKLIHFVLDIAMIMIMTFALAWEFILSTVFFNPTGIILRDALLIFYPLMDLTLLSIALT